MTLAIGLIIWVGLMILVLMFFAGAKEVRGNDD